MKLVLDSEGKLFATHDDDQNITQDMYPGCIFQTVPNSTKIDFENREYDTSGCTQEEWDAVNAPPTKVTMRQARLALLQSGLLASIEAAIDAIEDETEKAAVRIEWEYAMDVDRTHAWVQSLATGLGLSETDLDNLFTLADTFKAE
jgi:hypothetical protein